MSRPQLRRDAFAEWLGSDSDVPFDVWLRERDALAQARALHPPRRPLWQRALRTGVGMVLAIAALYAGLAWIISIGEGQ